MLQERVLLQVRVQVLLLLLLLLLQQVALLPVVSAAIKQEVLEVGVDAGGPEGRWISQGSEAVAASE